MSGDRRGMLVTVWFEYNLHMTLSLLVHSRLRHTLLRGKIQDFERQLKELQEGTLLTMNIVTIICEYKFCDFLTMMILRALIFANS